jgi:hypothetical protein
MTTSTTPGKKPAIRQRTAAAEREAMEDAFIGSAPDAETPAAQPSEERARPRGRPVKKAERVPVSFTIDKDLLFKVDQYARRMGVSRASLVAMALAQVTEKGLHLE